LQLFYFSFKLLCLKILIEIYYINYLTFLLLICVFSHSIDIEDGLLYDNLAWIEFAVFRQIKV